MIRIVEEGNWGIFGKPNKDAKAKYVWTSMKFCWHLVFSPDGQPIELGDSAPLFLRPQRQMSMKRLSRDEAFLIAVNIAKLPSVPRQILKDIPRPPNSARND